MITFDSLPRTESKRRQEAAESDVDQRSRSALPFPVRGEFLPSSTHDTIRSVLTQTFALLCS